MIENQEVIDFNRSKIYEKLVYQPEPANYSAKIPWVVQQQIAATNGIHYADRVGFLEDYPRYALPVARAEGQKLMLDIGNGWGRWLVAGHQAGYLPIGIDLRLEFCLSAKETMQAAAINRYTLVADLENLPFQANIFDLVWSFSVIQHTHIDRMKNCLKAVNTILNVDGFALLEFPNKNGLRNKWTGNVAYSQQKQDDYNSWCVRYYSPDEYKAIIENYLIDFEYDTHSFFGIGVLADDLAYVSFKHKIRCLISLLGTKASQFLPFLKKYADSLYIKAKKQQEIKIANSSHQLSTFWKNHQRNPTDNLNLVPLLKCPLTNVDLVLNEDRTKLISVGNGFYYPIENDIPIVIGSEKKNL